MVIVLMTFMVLTVLGVSVTAVATSRFTLSVSYNNLQGALYAAQSGIEDMKRMINECIEENETAIKAELQDYISLNYGLPGYDADGYSKQRTKHYVFDSFLEGNSFQRQLGVKNAAYSTQVFSEQDYDCDEGTVTVYSTGTYGSGGNTSSKTIEAKILIETVSSEFSAPGDDTGNSLLYPLIVNGPDIDNNSLRAYCKFFNVIGSFYIPKGIQEIAGGNNYSLTFSDYLICLCLQYPRIIYGFKAFYSKIEYSQSCNCHNDHNGR